MVVTQVGPGTRLDSPPASPPHPPAEGARGASSSNKEQSGVRPAPTEQEPRRGLLRLSSDFIFDFFFPRRVTNSVTSDHGLIHVYRGDEWRFSSGDHSYQYVDRARFEDLLRSWNYTPTEDLSECSNSLFTSSAELSPRVSANFGAAAAAINPNQPPGAEQIPIGPSKPPPSRKQESWLYIFYSTVYFAVTIVPFLVRTVVTETYEFVARPARGLVLSLFYEYPELGSSGSTKLAGAGMGNPHRSYYYDRGGERGGSTSGACDYYYNNGGVLRGSASGGGVGGTTGGGGGGREDYLLTSGASSSRDPRKSIDSSADGASTRQRRSRGQHSVATSGSVPAHAVLGNLTDHIPPSSRGPARAGGTSTHHSPLGPPRFKFPKTYFYLTSIVLNFRFWAQWTFTFVRYVQGLVVTGILLLPGALWTYKEYLSGKRFLIETFQYGRHSRNLLTVSYPAELSSVLHGGDELHQSTRKYPLVILVTGGAWTIGHRFWCAPITGPLAESNKVVTITIDYRNYPAGCFTDMVEDITAAFRWIRHAIGGGQAIRVGGSTASTSSGAAAAGAAGGAALAAAAGSGYQSQMPSSSTSNPAVPKLQFPYYWRSDGRVKRQSPLHEKLQLLRGRVDVNEITVAGQSCGAHLALMTLLREDFRFQNFFGWSGVYDLPALEEHLHRQQIPPELLSLFAGVGNKIEDWSPLQLLAKHPLLFEKLPRKRIRLFHGINDVTAPDAQSVYLAELLRHRLRENHLTSLVTYNVSSEGAGGAAAVTLTGASTAVQGTGAGTQHVERHVPFGECESLVHSTTSHGSPVAGAAAAGAAAGAPSSLTGTEAAGLLDLDSHSQTTTPGPKKNAPTMDSSYNRENSLNNLTDVDLENSDGDREMRQEEEMKEDENKATANQPAPDTGASPSNDGAASLLLSSAGTAYGSIHSMHTAYSSVPQVFGQNSFSPPKMNNQMMLSLNPRKVDLILSDEYDTHMKSVVEYPLRGENPVAKQILLLCGVPKGEVDAMRFRRATSWMTDFALWLVSCLTPF